VLDKVQESDRLAFRNTPTTIGQKMYQIFENIGYGYEPCTGLVFDTEAEAKAFLRNADDDTFDGQIKIYSIAD
jgi:hypothetical protein